ncbi:epimerase family protein SDR39U1 isoform X2 [Dermatophagoides pteronyssinus]
MPRPDSITWDDLNQNGIPDGTDAVINVAGQNVLDPMRRWTPGFKQNVIASRVHTNQMLVKVINQCDSQKKPKVFASISGVGYYRPDAIQIYDENSTGGDHDFLSKLCTDWEKASKVGDDHTRNVTVRSGIVLGKNGGIIQQMYPLFFLGLGAKIDSGTQHMPWIHIEDICNIFIQALRNEKFTGVINAVAPEIVTNEQFTKTFARLLRRPSFLFIPAQIIEFIFSSERAVMMTQGQKVISKRMEELGVQIKYPTIEEALKNILK